MAKSHFRKSFHLFLRQKMQTPSQYGYGPHHCRTSAFLQQALQLSRKPLGTTAGLERGSFDQC